MNVQHKRATHNTIITRSKDGIVDEVLIATNDKPVSNLFIENINKIEARSRHE